ncbi:hypothetical protein KFX60_17645, partial [Bacteroides thetaiotaomicron]|nr:hypothetical protein [Bacteroides thetaiotaomicron]
MKRYTIGILMMFLFINISLAQTADTAVKSDELQTTTTSVDEVGVAPAEGGPPPGKKKNRAPRGCQTKIKKKKFFFGTDNTGE